MQDTIQTFIEKFLIPTPGKSPQAIKDRILHWVEVANHPEKFTSTQDIHAIAAKRKNALTVCQGPCRTSPRHYRCTFC